MLKEYFDLLSKRIPRELFATPTSAEVMEAAQLGKAKMNMEELGAGRKKERKYKTFQNKRSDISKNSLLFNKQPVLPKEKEQPNIKAPTSSLLGDLPRGNHRHA